jgi:citrate lyase beta subunit
MIIANRTTALPDGKLLNAVQNLFFYHSKKNYRGGAVRYNNVGPGAVDMAHFLVEQLDTIMLDQVQSTWHISWWSS